MRISRTVVEQMILLLGLAVHGQASRQIAIQVNDYVGVPTGALERAEKQASKIFRHAGIEIVWRNRVLSGTTVPQARPKKERRNLDFAEVTLNILSRPMALRLRPDRFGNDFQLGMALLNPEQGFGKVAYLFFHRFQKLVRLANPRTGDEDAIFGHAMAHEIGHLLLNTSMHASEGIMRVLWDKTQLKHASRGWLVFTQAQAEQMQANLAARTAMARK